jgi:Skp family chaperone for outer membrane proteins
MIRNVFRLSALLLTAAVAVPTASVQAQGGGGVAFVYMRAVLQQTPGYAQAESTWVAEFEGFRNEILKLQEDLNTAVAKFEESSVMLSASNRATERKKLEDLETAMRTREAELQQRAQTRRQELLDPIEERVMSVVEGVRAEGNYAIVFDVSNQASAIIAADKTKDLTVKVIDRLKASAGGN